MKFMQIIEYLQHFTCHHNLNQFWFSFILEVLEIC